MLIDLAALLVMFESLLDQRELQNFSPSSCKNSGTKIAISELFWTGTAPISTLLSLLFVDCWGELAKRVLLPSGVGLHSSVQYGFGLGSNNGRCRTIFFLLFLFLVFLLTLHTWTGPDVPFFSNRRYHGC